MKIGIIGNGFVGKATKLLKSISINIMVYDIRSDLCEPIGTTLTDIELCDLIFICLPTPLGHDGSFYTKLIEDTAKKIINPYKIIRSTVPIGFSHTYQCFFMPEFLTELNWKNDFINADHWIFGLTDNDVLNDEFKKRITYVMQTSQLENSIKNSTIYWTTSSEAEFIKLAKNCFLATKVSIANELYDLANKKNINYDNIKNILQLDKRIGLTHLNVPGYNNSRGYGGTCFPKDIHNLYYQFQESNIKSYMFASSLDRNENLDRPNREWTLDKWRTSLPTDKKISLVTGGAGFIGSHLCKKLLELDHIVICLDNLQTGFMENITEFKNPNFIFKNGDVVDKHFFPHLDYIWHLACPASPEKYQVDGYKTLQTCLIGTMNMLELCNTHQCKFLFTSTSEIYGDPLVHPQSESYWGNTNPVGPRSCYDEGKRCAETLIYEFRNKYPDLKIVRIFNTYGPKMNINDGRVITNYIKSILQDNPITIYGDGNQTRSFCFIDDMIDGLILMMDSDAIGPINLGNPYTEITMIELKNIFEKIIGKNTEIEYRSLPKDDPHKRNPDITYANKQLNWNPKIDLEIGLKNVLEYFYKKHNMLI